MAWTAPMTAIPGDVFTAAQFNTHVRDNLNYLKTQTDTNASDISTGNTNITNLTNWTRRGTQTITDNSGSNTGGALSFSVSFGITFPGVPTVTTNIADGGATTARWSSKAYNITTTGCSVVCAAPTTGAVNWTNVPVQWIATYRA
jgi:hypothetical protein